MPQIYTHYYGNEASESLLVAYGIISEDKRATNTLKPKQCPNCNLFIIPFIPPIAELFGFRGLSVLYLSAIAIIVLIYIVTAEMVKRMFYKRVNL